MPLPLFLFTVRNQSLLCWLGADRGSGLSPDLQNQRETLPVLTVDPFFWERRVKGPSPPPTLSSWICTEANRCPAGPSWRCWQDSHAGCPPRIPADQLKRPLPLKCISAMQEPSWRSAPCFCGPSLPSTWWGRQLLTGRGLTYPVSLRSYCWLPWACFTSDAPWLALQLPHTQLDLFTWNWLLKSRLPPSSNHADEWTPVSLLTVPSCKLLF